MKNKKIIEHIVQWLGDYLDQSGLKGFTIGISGGIDSAVASTLCALSGKTVLALNMPIYQAEDQLSRASKHISRLEKTFPNAKGEYITIMQIIPNEIKGFRFNIDITVGRKNNCTCHAFIFRQSECPLERR